MAGRLGWAGVVAVATFGVLLVLSPLYGFHRDELYFVIAGRHPALGYVDQPPFTPIVSAIGVALLGATPVAVRILAALALAACVWLCADMAARFGGGSGARIIAAVTLVGTGLLMGGHFGHTATFDVLAWTVILWLMVRLLDGGDPRLWPVLGLVAGIGLENKYLVALLGAGLAVGLVLARRWDVLRSPWAWSAVGLALLLWLPNLAWQAANDWPQLEMARRLAERAAEERDSFVVELILVGGALMAWVPVLGTGRLLLARDMRPWRTIGWATLVILALVVFMNGKSYYLLGILAPLVASGAVAVERWIGRGRMAVRATVYAVPLVVSIAVIAVLVLPIVPASSLASTPINDVYGEAGEQIGWPEMAAEVGRVADGLSPEDRARAVVITSNYGEAGALELLGDGLPPIYSGHNSYWDWGPPPEDRTLAIVVASGGYRPPGLYPCTNEGRVDNGVGLDNDEQGVPILVCERTASSWTAVWPQYRHLD